MVHQLKIEQKYFKKIAEGVKTYEIRKNDRDFRAGDYLWLNEIADCPCEGTGERLETGRFILVKVLDVYESLHRLAPGYVIMAIQPCEIMETRPRTVTVYEGEGRNGH